ncbi:beta-galactosidase [Granulicella arctica]|uniref:Beta-galactosidase n=1 Tax=Granulicella arctica TaxID=940613 RepID=A0A7Y9PFH7_9BACT|nr:beta-galactosidase [Granulicella arctica]NYF78967.1 beta-galactosidase [Granulicella arctica]
MTMHALSRMMTSLLCTCALAASCVQIAPAQAQHPNPSKPAQPGTMTDVLYGAAYYHEYMPSERLDKDIALMKAAGLTVVRMGESTWSLWEPEDGKFEYAWMDRVVDAMGKAGIKVIMGTPTYSIPTWMYREHPEILARPLHGGETSYGMRQNMDTDSPAFRFYAQRLIRNMVEHYKDNPNVIGWQIDNETSSYGAANQDVFIGFVNHLKQKFGTTDALNKAWGLNYWGQDVNGWENMPTRDGTISTGYKLEWTRWEQMRVTDYLNWQAALVREYRGPGQFVTQDFGGSMRRDVNEFEISKSLDIAANNPYHGTQDHFDGQSQAEQGDYTRSLKHTNFLVTETNAQTTDWSSAYQYPPYDGQLRLDVYTHLSSGANMVEYWHWASIPSGQETYWKGVLSHDLEPNRAYAEVSRTAHELQKIGPHLVNLKIKNDVAILYSVDSANALDFMPFALERTGQWQMGRSLADYKSLVDQLHRAFYEANVGTDFIFPEDPDFNHYKLIVIPPLYIADDALLQKISDYVKNGGHVLMTFKSGFANENSAVRAVRAPGPLREAAGFSYQEFSNLEKPLTLQGGILKDAGSGAAMYWAEFLLPEHAKALATYDHPFFGRWPAITRNEYGAGTLTYEGTYLSSEAQKAVVLDVLNQAHLLNSTQELPAPVREKDGTNGMGKALHYYLNYSGTVQTFHYARAAGTDLLTGHEVAAQQSITLAPWDLAIIEER